MHCDFGLQNRHLRKKPTKETLKAAEHALHSSCLHVDVPNGLEVCWARFRSSGEEEEEADADDEVNVEVWLGSTTGNDKCLKTCS